MREKNKLIELQCFILKDEVFFILVKREIKWYKDFVK